MTSIAAVVATHNRPELLAGRALASIAGQTRHPDYLIVVDDSDAEFRRANAEVVSGLHLPDNRKIYLENRRTPGASGAWNTALFRLHGIDASAYVAVLDDDDSWAETYLERCDQAITEGGLDMVAAGLVFHRFQDTEAAIYYPPFSLEVDDLLVRNPHVQGSNLFVRLSHLLKAGGFDEALSSTTDRDICIRLADLGTIRYGGLREGLVHHFADNDRPRLSTPGSDAKRAGQRYFFRKYRGRMSDEQQAAFIDRSQRLFDCDPTEPLILPAPAMLVSEASISETPLTLVAGAITSPDTGLVERLLNSLGEKVRGREGVTLRVILLENGGYNPFSRQKLQDVVVGATKQGHDIAVKTLEEQTADVEAGVFAATSEQLSGRRSIALSRTMLQHYLFMEAKPLPGAVVWILDDDVVLEGLAYGADGSLGSQDVDWVSEIRRLKESGASIVLCEVTGDPPLPTLSCVRTQLVDLYHNLHRLAAMSPDSMFPGLRDENRLARLENADYYYDLSSSGTRHLERPFWYEPTGQNWTAGEVFREMVARLPEILDGVQVFRPLVYGEQSSVGAGLSSSINRGPATLVFDLQALRDFPNAVPAVDGAYIRRSDMVWSLLNRYAGGREVVQARLPVRQIRSTDIGDVSMQVSLSTMEQDLLGYAFYSSLRDMLQRREQQHQLDRAALHRSQYLEFTDAEVEMIAGLFRKHLAEKVSFFEFSFIRIMGLISALKPFCQTPAAGDRDPSWLDEREFADSLGALGRFVAELGSFYTNEQLEGFKQRVTGIDSTVIEDFLKQLPEVVQRHRTSTPLPLDVLQQTAEEFVQSEFATGPLTCLGTGEEGVVLTDGRLAYKYFHYWRARDRSERVAFLKTLAGRISGYRTLPDLLEVREKGECVVAVYPCEEGTKYEGDHLEDLLTLLRETRRAGIACRNIHPDNLTVTPSGVKFIDFGSDIVPWDESEFEQMCRRAYLSYKFPFRSDLKRLMTESLTDTSMPELTGLDRFLRAIDPRGLDELYYQPMADLISAEMPVSVLDYGCGDGRLAEMLTDREIHIIGYDPDSDMASRYLDRREHGTYGDWGLLQKLLAEAVKFDMVVCGRVLCTIADKIEFNDALRDLRRLVSDSGAVLVAVCNPFHLSTESTELWRRHLHAEFEYQDTFVYDKTVASSDNTRREVHRSYDNYRRAFISAGFHVEAVIEMDGTDIGALLPSSDHLVFQLKPAPIDGLKVSLLIKTCAMEWRTIERTVRHLVDQLETPVRFVDKVVVVDTFEGPFARQYDEPDAEAHRAAMDRLLSGGVVDHVVYAPDTPEVVRATYRKWFGAESDHTHSANGQQLFATLYGFESCISEYVLQVDSDLLVTRHDRGHDYLAEMIDVLSADIKALFVPLSIFQQDTMHYTHKGPNGDWRVEVRGCLFDRERLESVLPIHNEVEKGRFTLAWHRAFDKFIVATDYHSYRGGDPRTAFIHVPNDRKSDHLEWMDIAGSVERGHVPASQIGNVELRGSASDWAGPKRYEPFVFVICGRNVDPGRFKRCFQSLVAQSVLDWGAVVVDDASTNAFGDYARMLLVDYGDRVTLVRNEQRRGGMYNTWNAVTNFCVDPESVIITLDADDALIGEHVLERVQAGYEDGADATVGSMLRLDKEASYLPNFNNPRWWDSNVWQHLRTFKKRLFDAIDVEDLKLDGEWIDVATDWAFMVPIIEMASSPRHIAEPLYLYEPAEPKNEDSRRERNSVIARILAKRFYEKLR